MFLETFVILVWPTTNLSLVCITPHCLSFAGYVKANKCLNILKFKFQEILKANNHYMKIFNPTQKRKFLMLCINFLLFYYTVFVVYLDGSNIYGHAMRRHFPNWQFPLVNWKGNWVFPNSWTTIGLKSGRHIGGRPWLSTSCATKLNDYLFCMEN